MQAYMISSIFHPYVKIQTLMSIWWQTYAFI